MTISIKGIAVSRGIAIGRAYKLERGQPDIHEACITDAEIENEIQRLEHALKIARAQLNKIQEKIPHSTPLDIAAFIDTHLLMMDDPALTEAPTQLIRTKKCNAEWALKLQLDSLVEVFDQMNDAYLKTRKDDVIHVVNRILRILLEEDMPAQEDIQTLHTKIIIADDLTPADIVMLHHQGIAGFITESGGPLSHTAILARSLKLPAIVGIHNAKRYLQNNDHIIIDGEQGTVLIDANKEIEADYKNRQQAYQDYYSSLNKLKDKPSITLDQVPIHLLANAELPEDMQTLHDYNIDGIGLYRTEFLFMNRDTLPDENEQYETYMAMVSTMQGRPVTIRTLDLGADKPLKNIKNEDCPTNPALGLRAIRLCLNNPELFRPQLRAILRASAKGQVRMMIPMLSNTQEIHQVFKILDDVKRELRQQGHAFDDHMQIGGMIEIPAAAISSYLFAKHLDFLSIGTNDLIQYTLAIDRIDEEVNYLYSPCHPSVLRLIHQVIKAGKRARIPVAMCGEMAGDPVYTRLLLGLGLREFSMQANTILEVKDVITHSRIDNLRKAGLAILQSEHAEEALSKIEMMNKKIH
ncbi:MAG: phosphoenolpyruvate--protein phosphotransferase [Gammaproteobacteria bacterium]|nr:phosphoenolpyruvate--protein phosphotransferase [Gammaproteobacteria bacterium]